jgi:protein pelota
MRIIHKDLKNGELKFEVDSLDDLWYLSHIITEGDRVSGRSFRKIKLGGEGENQKIIKKAFFLTIDVEKVEFSKYSNILRVSGKTTEGFEDVPKASYHTFGMEPGETFTLHKESFLSYQIEKLEEASSEKQPELLLLVLDREDAYFAVMKKYGYETLTHLQGNVQKKGIEHNTTNFYLDVYKTLSDYDARYKPSNIIVASPIFFKEDFMKEVNDPEIKKKIVLAICSSVTDNAFNELLKRDEVKSVLMKDKITKEMKLVESLMTEISKEGKATYGFNETEQASYAGAVDSLLITDNFILKKREENDFEKVDNIMKSIDRSKGKINIISSEHDGGKQLDGLGGIGAILRYKI